MEVGFSLRTISPYITPIHTQELAQDIQHLSDGWYTIGQNGQEKEAEIN